VTFYLNDSSPEPCVALNTGRNKRFMSRYKRKSNVATLSNHSTALYVTKPTFSNIFS
jgi:hypothetical protein